MMMCQSTVHICIVDLHIPDVGASPHTIVQILSGTISLYDSVDFYDIQNKLLHFFVIKQRPSWLMWCCFYAWCFFGQTPNWPLEENRKPKNQAKAVHHGLCCCLHLALPPSLPCLVYRCTAVGCGQPNQALVQIKYLLAKVFILKAK